MSLRSLALEEVARGEPSSSSTENLPTPLNEEMKKEIAIGKLADYLDHVSEYYVGNYYKWEYLPHYSDLKVKYKCPKDTNPLTPEIFKAAEIIYSRLKKFSSEFTNFEKNMIYISLLHQSYPSIENEELTAEETDMSVYFGRRIEDPDEVIDEVYSELSNIVHTKLVKLFEDTIFEGFNNDERKIMQSNLNWMKENLLQFTYFIFFPVYLPISIK